MLTTSDTGCVTDENWQYYERSMTFADWHPEDDSLLAKATVRVHRYPSGSHATLYIFDLEELKWVPVHSIPFGRFWSRMPGFRRSHTLQADERSAELIRELLQVGKELAESGSI